MSEATVRACATTQPGQQPPPIDKDQAVSFIAPFETVKDMIAAYPAPRRPNRNRPIHAADPLLREELDAWNAASDEALERFEDDLAE